MEDEKAEEILIQIEQIELKQSFQSQRDFTIDQVDEEHEKKLKRKEKKLKETYYLIKLYMIIQKTSTIFLKNCIDISQFFIGFIRYFTIFIKILSIFSFFLIFLHFFIFLNFFIFSNFFRFFLFFTIFIIEMILKIKDTLKEIEKYTTRVKSREAFINMNNYRDYLSDYIDFYNMLQIVIKELDFLESKDLSGISRKSQDKNVQHYESDSNSKFLGTPPRRYKSKKDKTDEEVPVIQLEKVIIENKGNFFIIFYKKTLFFLKRPKIR